jgi:plasmid maintenance system antidote protein VapI
MRASRRSTPTLSDQLRDAIQSGPKTPHAIASEADVDPAVVSRFLTGKRTLQLSTADRLAGVLRLRLASSR